MEEVQCYSLRRVNPFRGLVAVVRTESARAISVDGVHWQVQVLAHAPRGLWANTEYAETLQYFRFGLWSAEEGLTRVPLNPMLDLGRMLAAADTLTRVLPERTGGLPFPLARETELWLLDRDQRPLALLATAMEGTDISGQETDQWSAGGRGDRPFVSASLSVQGIRSGDPGSPHRHAEILENLIRRTAGRNLNRRWYRLGEAGEGEPVAGSAAQPDAGDRLPAGLFPSLSVRDVWPDGADQALVSDYLSWLSPYLLMLPTLSDEARRHLEREAVRHALLVEATWRLYPKILDPTLLKQARVEARLRLAAGL